MVRTYSEFSEFEVLEILRLWRMGYTDRDIADVLGHSSCSIGDKRRKQGWTQRPSARVEMPFGVRFENVTKSEAHKILATSPPSMPYSRETQSPATSAALCIEGGTSLSGRVHYASGVSRDLATQRNRKLDSEAEALSNWRILPTAHFKTNTSR